MEESPAEAWHTPISHSHSCMLRVCPSDNIQWMPGWQPDLGFVALLTN